MCLAIPGKIIEIDRSDPDLTMAKVDFAGVIKTICIQWIPDAAIGDYILTHVGMALDRINEKEATETLNLLMEIGGLSLPPEEE